MRILKILLFLVLILRINLFVVPPFKVDMDGWKAWSYKLAQTGPQSFYSKDYFSDYFPGYLYILWGTGSLFNILSMPINGVLFEFFIKFVTSLFDIGCAVYIFKIVSRYNRKWAHFAPVLYLANPAIIFNSSVWGQVDGIFTFFLLMSAFFLFEKKKLYKSSISLTIGSLIKPHGLAFSPVFLLYLFKNFSKEKIVRSLLIGALILVALSFPFFPKNPIAGLINLATSAQNVYPYTSLFAFNFWGMFGAWKPDNQIFIFSFKIWGIILYLFSLILIFAPAVRKNIDTKQLYFATSLSFFSFFIFLTRMHERYLFPFLAFMLIAVFVNKSRALLTSWILISVLHFLNLWFVYYYYNFVYVSSFSQSTFLEKLYPSFVFINSYFKHFSLLMLISFGFLLLYYYKLHAKKS